MPEGVPTFVKFAKQRQERYFAALRKGIGRFVAARKAGVSAELIRLYRKSNPEFAAAEIEAEMELDDEVQHSLAKAAFKGNVAACCAWLYNRRPEEWKDRRKDGYGEGGSQTSPAVVIISIGQPHASGVPQPIAERLISALPNGDSTTIHPDEGLGET